MKKISFVLLLVFLINSSFRGNPPFILNFIKEDAGATVYFVLQDPDENNTLQKLSQALGKPSSNTTGVMEWKNIHIDGVADKVTVTITDGIHTHDPATHTGCWVPFKNDADKKERLNRMVKNQDRVAYINFKDEKGNGFVSNNQVEQRLQAFLETRIQL